jgi:hypothetical protein
MLIRCGQATEQMDVVDDLGLGAFVSDANGRDNGRIGSANYPNVVTTPRSSEAESVRLDRAGLSRRVGADAKWTDRIDVSADAKVESGQVLFLRAPRNEMVAASAADRLEDGVRLSLRRKSNDH